MNSTKGAVASTVANALLSPHAKEADADQIAPAAAEGDRGRTSERAAEADNGGGAEGAGGPAVKREAEEHTMEDADGVATSTVPPATVFRIRLRQPPSNLRHKMSVPELCRNFRSSL